MGIGMSKGRRDWSEDKKRSICLQARAPGGAVALVARRHSLNANLIFKWLRDPRFALTVWFSKWPWWEDPSLGHGSGLAIPGQSFADCECPPDIRFGSPLGDAIQKSPISQSDRAFSFSSEIFQ
ncbi:MAG: transposase [Sedimenticola sp.]